MDEVNNPLQQECDDGGVSESFTSLKDGWAYDGDLYSCTGTVNDCYSEAAMTSPLRWGCSWLLLGADDEARRHPRKRLRDVRPEGVTVTIYSTDGGFTSKG